MSFLKQSLIAAALAAAVATPAWSAASLEFVPAAGSFTAGSNIDVAIVISGLNAGEQLGAFDFVVNFDSTVLGLSTYQLGNQLGDVAAFEAMDTSAGILGGGQFNLGQVSFLWDLSSQPTSFTLATLTFSALAAGTSNLGFSDVTLGDAWGEPLAAEFGTAEINVSAVPEPGMPAMLFAGLGLLGLMARRRQQA